MPKAFYYNIQKTEVFKITHETCDSEVPLKLACHYGSVTRGNKYNAVATVLSRRNL